MEAAFPNRVEVARLAALAGIQKSSLADLGAVRVLRVRIGFHIVRA